MSIPNAVSSVVTGSPGQVAGKLDYGLRMPSIAPSLKKIQQFKRFTSYVKSYWLAL